MDLLELCCCGFVLQYFGLQSFADKPQQKTDQKSSSDEAGDEWLFAPKNPFPVHTLPKGTIGLLGKYSRAGILNSWVFLPAENLISVLWTLR